MSDNKTLSSIGKRIWKEIEGFPDYKISNYGQIKSRKNDIKLLKPVKNCVSGHLSIILCKNKTKNRKLIHRLVLESFEGPCPEGMECCHDDGNPENNHISNLRWDTRKNNRADCRKHGTNNVGERNGGSKLTASDIIEIRRLSDSGMKRRKIGHKFNITVRNICAIVLRRTWRHI